MRQTLIRFWPYEENSDCMLLSNIVRAALLFNANCYLMQVQLVEFPRKPLKLVSVNCKARENYRMRLVLFIWKKKKKKTSSSDPLTLKNAQLITVFYHCSTPMNQDQWITPVLSRNGLGVGLRLGLLALYNIIYSAAFHLERYFVID